VELGRRLPLGLVLVLALAACGGSGKHQASQATTTDANGCIPVTAAAGKARTATRPTKALAAGKTYDVAIKTNCGDFTIRLAVQTAPATTASFASLVRNGYFDGTVFHRIVPGFVIQGGDPTGSGTGGPGYTTQDAPAKDTRYVKGSVAMAKAGPEPPGTAGSQFFVVTDDAGGANLTPDYALVGQISDGLDVVEAIGQLGDVAERPIQVIKIEKATVKGG
jgi:peptidyl-prolyl cis-trans isomerase B (cyclophilin B)